MRDKGSHFPDVESKRNTTTVQQKSGRVRERETPKIDLEAIRAGSVIGTGLLLCLAPSLCPAQAHRRTHTHRLLGLGSRLGGGKNPIALVGLSCVIPVGSELPRVEVGLIPGCQQVKIHF